MPAGTPPTAKLVEAPTGSEAIGDENPGETPATSRYDVTAPPPDGAAQLKLAEAPLTVATRFVGAPGAAAAVGTVSATPGASGPAPLAFEAATVR